MRSERGQGLVEFAVVFPLFVFFLFAIVDGGLLFGRYGDINNAAKEGARVGAVDGDLNDVLNTVKAQAHGVLDKAGPNCVQKSGKPLICVEAVEGPGIGGIGSAEGPGEVGSAIRVRVKYHYNLLTPLNGLFGTSANWDIEACAIQRLEQRIETGGAGIPAATGQSSCDEGH